MGVAIMGNEIVAARSTELFSFNGHYSVPGDNTRHRLLDDAGCFMASALALLRKELEVADSRNVKAVEPELAERLWGVYHLLQMVAGITEAAHKAPQESSLEHVA
jgi:hypothetical protein